MRHRRHHPSQTPTSDVGSEMTRMLQSMKHRGPDSTGYALFGPPSDLVVIRFKLADANDPRDFDFRERLERHRMEVESRLGKIGAHVDRVETETEYAYRALVRYDGDLKALADYLEDVPGLRGALARPLARDREGPRRCRTRSRTMYDLAVVPGHARDRTLPHGDRVRRRHLGRPPVLGLPVLRRRGGAQRSAHELLPMEAAPRGIGAPVPVRV